MKRATIRGASDIDPNRVYNIEYQPMPGAPTYVYGIFGEQSAKTTYVHGKTVLKLGDKLAKEKYSQHYIISAKPEKSWSKRDAELAEKFASENDRQVRRLHDDAMKQLSRFYQHSLIEDYGSEWEYQPKGGDGSNSPREE